MNEAEVSLKDLPGPTLLVEPALSIATEFLGQINQACVYYWEESTSDEPVCFDHGEFIQWLTIEHNLAIDVDIVPNRMDNQTMRDYSVDNGIWAETNRLIRSIIFDWDIQI